MAAITYKKAGVDIDKADTFVKTIKPLLERAKRPEVLGLIKYKRHQISINILTSRFPLL